MTHEERLRELELIRLNKRKLKVGIIIVFTRLSPRVMEQFVHCVYGE